MGELSHGDEEPFCQLWAETDQAARLLNVGSGLRHLNFRQSACGPTGTFALCSQGKRAEMLADPTCLLRSGAAEVPFEVAAELSGADIANRESHFRDRHVLSCDH